jgi:DNA-binding response OmpR family regulator
MSSSSGIRSRSILLVEADRRTSQRLAGLLQEDGFQVEALYDGASAMARLGKEPLPDTIITELTLPNIDGASVARFALANDSRIRIIVLTRHPHLAKSPIFGVHSSTVLTKPLDYARLLQLLSGAPANDVRHDHALRHGA